MTLAADQIAFYGASQKDYTSAMAVASSLGVPYANVTGSFNTAAQWVANGDFMVIAIGGPAETALFWNPCGWSTTAYSLSQYPACSTPFNYYNFPYDGAIEANYFESAAGIYTLESMQLALMLGYYAINGVYPPNTCALPTVYERSGTCSTGDCNGSATNSCPVTS